MMSERTRVRFENPPRRFRTAWLPLLILGASVLAFASCGDEPEVTAPQDRVGAAGENIRQEAEGAVEAAVEATEEEMDRFRQEMNVRVAEMGRQIDSLKTRASEAMGASQAEYQETLTYLEQKMENASEKLAALKEAGAEEWSEAKSDMEAAMTDLQSAYDRAVTRGADS